MELAQAKHLIYGGGVGERNETESARALIDVVIHNHGVYNLPKLGEVLLEGIIVDYRGYPTHKDLTTGWLQTTLELTIVGLLH